MKNLITLTVLLLATLNLSAQDKCYETFKAEGIKEFNACRYQQAIDNFKVGNGCDDKPENNDILTWIEKAGNCIYFRKQADSLFRVNKFEIARFFYNETLTLNKADTYCASQLVACDEKMRCFAKNREEGILSFDKAEYDDALNHYSRANACEVKPETNDLIYLIQKVNDCLSLRAKADSLFIANPFLAKDYYEQALAMSPQDQYCKQKIAEIKAISKWFVTTNSGLLTPMGIRIAYMKVWGVYAGARGATGEDNWHYSFTGGVTRQIMAKKEIKLHLYAGAGSSSYSDYYWEGGSRYGFDYPKGIELELGIKTVYKRLVLDTGFSLLNYGEQYDFVFGIGYSF